MTGTIAASDQVLIRVGLSNNAANTIASSDIDDTYNGVLTVPNGYIGYLTSISVFTPSQGWINVMKWDTTSALSTTYQFYNTSNQHFSSGFNGSIGGIYTAGESIALQRVTALGASVACGMFTLEPI
jgi:hypothetical protein